MARSSARMNAKFLTVIAQIKAKPGSEAQVRQELLSLVAPSRKDAGCLNYDLHQAQDNSALFMFHENWTTKACLDQHLQKPELQAVLARVGQLVAEPPRITLWEKIA
jgi:quinol monooxygenase YgiN